MSLLETSELLDTINKDINITNKNTNDINTKVSFKQLISFLYLIGSNKYMNNDFQKKYDKLCVDILTPNIHKFTTQIKLINLYNLTNLQGNSINFINNVKYVKIDKKKTYIIITDSIKFANAIKSTINNVQCIIYNYKNDKHLINNEFIFINNDNQLKKYIFNNSNDKKDNIIIRFQPFLVTTYIKYNILISIPKYLTGLSLALTRLNKHGDLYLFFNFGLLNKVFEKIIDLLNNSFQKVEIYNETGTECLLKCINFSDNINDKTINKFNLIALNSVKYSYNICDFFNYVYYIEKKLPNNNLSYHLDDEILNKNYKSYQATMKIINDIDLPFTNLLHTQNIIYQITKMHNNYENELYKNILRYSIYENNKLIVDNEFINRINYNKILNFINYYESNKLPYNKAYLTYINKFNKNLLNQLFTYDYSLNQKVIKYNQKKPNNEKIHKLKDSYYYDEFNTQYDLWTLSYKVKLNLLEKLKTDDTPKIIKQVSEGFARGVSAHIMKNFNLEHKVSNAFCKLWEIYSTVKGVLPMKANPKVFFMAEAPGQWIYSTNLYYFNNYRQKVRNSYKSRKIGKTLGRKTLVRKTLKSKKSNKITTIKGIEWRANSLNPNNQINIKKYGKDIFNDQYGFMRKYPKQWVFGADDTGDFTITDNQRWYRQYVKEFGKLDLITGDAGIYGDDPMIFQKLELAQVCMVAGLLSVGGNCVIKHFLPYVRRVPSTYYATGFFMNYMYLYYLMFDELHLIKPLTSNPDSGEFYVVGKGFKGITDDDYASLLKLLDNFEPNMCFFEKDYIEDTFVRQIVEFAEKIIKMNVDHNEITNLLMTCMIENDEIIEKATNCSKFLNKTYVEKVFAAKYKEWVVTNNFH